MTYDVKKTGVRQLLQQVSIVTSVVMVLGWVWAASAQEFYSTHHEHIPNFAEHPTVTSTRNGSWSDPATWSPSRIPTTRDVVLIRAGHRVIYNVVSDASLAAIGVEGVLQFRPDIATRMKVGSLLVSPEGTLEIGTNSSPVAAQATAEVIIANRPLATTSPDSDTKVVDPEQWGTGLLVLGRISIHGAPKTPTWVRLSAEPEAGDNTLLLQQSVSGWRAGDKLILPDSRQLKSSIRYYWQTSTQWEEHNLQSVSGSQLTLANPLAFDHPGARDGDGKLDFLPHVGNLSRNVIIRSENPQGTRGHTAVFERAAVDIRYALFKDLGRTTVKSLNSTTFDSSGNVTHIGTNQVGRYSVHLHHLMGPATPPGDGYQFKLIGNAVDGGLKWGLAIHDTHYGLVRDNIVYHVEGTGVVTEDGSESYNMIERNFVIRTGSPVTNGLSTVDDDSLSSGFWFRAGNNYVLNNVVANTDFVAYTFYPHRLKTVQIPAFPGASENTVTLSVSKTPILQFDGNEVYGITNTGLLFWYVSDPGEAGNPSVVKDFKAWHIHREIFNARYTAYVRLEGWIVRGDEERLPEATTNGSTQTVGIHFGRSTPDDVAIVRCDIQGLYLGIQMPTRDKGNDMHVVVEDSYLRNYIGISRESDWMPGDLIVDSTLFAPVNMPPLAIGPQRAIELRGTGGNSSHRNFVYAYNRVSSDNFQLFFIDGSAPCTKTRPELLGYVCPILP